ncbi:uncharacterized protein B0I36DRAFT_363733 [Microdochium trichocladiopsis]|uniref:Uncharacterized protein n=1 Tax=Microdochium trichocladiopsis TaxID=1682393 RepID=A0A9P9BPD5_9PEZI|nr:uncharacterized protein B0I36DRAFT_363733 [Microdochium trichocladiopsis]KAH7029154.1 hypothetical protein B0I36DRAFT_363733 [Microdochium trichocladiopsis]
MVQYKTADFPINEAAPFQGRVALYLDDGPERAMAFRPTSASTWANAHDGAETEILQIVSHATLDALATQTRGEPAALLFKAEGLLKRNLKGFYRPFTAGGSSSIQIDPQTTPRSRNDVEEQDLQPVVELSGPLMELGHWTLKFPSNDSSHSGHNIEYRPVGMSSRDDYFVKDSILYFWAVNDLTPTEAVSRGSQSDRGPRCSCSRLYKVVDGKRLEVARFWTKKHRDREGLFLVDDEQVDIVVAGATCVIVATRVDSFRK